MQREIGQLLEIRARYAHDAAVTTLVDHCIALCRRSETVSEPSEAEALRTEVESLLSRLTSEGGRP